MKKTVKDTLLSVIVLTAIALVCVILLSVANEFLKYEATLDAKMAKNLYAVCPTGEADDSKAIEYFEIVKMDEDIEKVNKTHGSPTNKIVAVYRATKGVNEGKYIVQSQAEGYGGTIMTLTSYDESGKVIKTSCIAHDAESHYDKLTGHTDFLTLVGKDGSVTADDVAAITGATSTRNGIAKAITLSNKMAKELAIKRFSKVIELTDFEEVTTTVAAKVEEVNAIYYDEEAQTKVLSVFKAKGGTYDGCYIVIAQSKNGQWYPPLQMMTAYTSDGKILKTECIYQKEGYWDKVNVAWFDNVSGKNGEIKDGDFATSTGATNTLVTIAQAINASNKLVELLLSGGAL